MELSPSEITEASFRTIRKGYDPDEVDAFLAECAKALEAARQQAIAMEARARAAVSRLQEAAAGKADDVVEPVPVPVAEPRPAEPAMPVVEAETISRTLLLAQRTADTAIAEARAEAERIVQEATREAEITIDSTREMSAKLLGEAKAEARRATEHERRAAENEVEALVARREFLIGDVDQLERFLIDQRDRLRGAARQIEALCDRVPAGLGTVRPPVLSASDDDEPGDPTMEIERPGQDEIGAATRGALDRAAERGLRGGPDGSSSSGANPVVVVEQTDEHLPVRTTNRDASGAARPHGDASGSDGR